MEAKLFAVVPGVNTDAFILFLSESASLQVDELRLFKFLKKFIEV